jgi:ferrochelatase
MEHLQPARPYDEPWGVLLLAHGAPERREEIPEYLLNVRGGRRLPDAVVQEIVRRYSLIGGGSPLLRLTNLQAEGLAKLHAHPVYVGMRNWKPFILDTVRRMSDEGVERAVVLCLAPQNSRASIGLYRRYLTDAIEKAAPSLQVDFVESWHDYPLLIAAFQEKVAAAQARVVVAAGVAVPIIFTAHSVPEKTITDGDTYERQVRETAGLVARAMGLNDYRVAFQSQGMTPEAWIGPTVESQLDLLASAGHRHVLIAPIGFVSDHVEILYDIDVAFREYGKKKGLAVWRSESLNDSPLFIQALASIVSSRVELWKQAVPPGEAR